jgi:outer membrane protein assembly factor BamD
LSFNQLAFAAINLMTRFTPFSYKRPAAKLLLAACAMAMLSGCGMFSGFSNWFGSKTDPKRDWTVEKFYEAAREEMDAGNYGSAVKLYEQLEAKFPFGRYAQQAQIEVAYAHYKEGDVAQAQSAVDRFVKLHPNHPNMDYVLYLKALSNFRVDLGPFSFLARQDLAERDQKAARESFDTFKELVQRFPESRYAEDSRLRMTYLVDALGRNETKIADYYFRRGAYVAALNRAQQSITRFPNASSRLEALEIMRDSYKALKMDDLANDTQAVISKNYKAGETAKPKWWKIW